MAAAAAKNIAKKSAAYAQAEQGDQRDYGQVPYFGVQSRPPPLPSAQSYSSGPRRIRSDDGVAHLPRRTTPTATAHQRDRKGRS